MSHAAPPPQRRSDNEVHSVGSAALSPDAIKRFEAHTGHRVPEPSVVALWDGGFLTEDVATESDDGVIRMGRWPLV